jgi:hypothetical protein
MKRFLIVLIVLLSASGLFADEVLYQKQHKNFDSMDVVALLKMAEDWYCINIVIAEDVDAIEKYAIYDTQLESIQDLLFMFEKEKAYKQRIKNMEKAETLLFIKEETGIQEGHILKTKHYLYVK